MSERDDGYYWLTDRRTGHRFIAELVRGGWYLCGSDVPFDEFEETDEFDLIVHCDIGEFVGAPRRSDAPAGR